MVAVKTVKENAGQTEMADLLSEYQLLKEVNHPNVIRLLGACTTAGGPVYLIIEYCALGSLRQYLRNCQKVEQIEEKEITPRQIISFSWQITKGMSYLAEMKLVHRDLATRNILLTESKQCKISDFGMTRDVYVDDTYLRISKGKVPVKWMAIESLRDQIYTCKSDVWSFGVVLWELVTLGSNPYPGIPVVNLYNQLKAGYRMQRPPNCSQLLYDIMCKCWHEEPSRRPGFSLLVEMFETMLEQDIDYLNCNIHAFNNPEYFTRDDSDSDLPNEEKRNGFNITFSMSLENLKPSEEPEKNINLYENNLSQLNEGYDIPKPIQETSFKIKNNKDSVIAEKVDNR